MNTDEINTELLRIDAEFISATKYPKTAVLDAELQTLYDLINPDQFDELSEAAYAVLEAYGYNDGLDRLPYHEGWE